MCKHLESSTQKGPPWSLPQLRSAWALGQEKQGGCTGLGTSSTPAVHTACRLCVSGTCWPHALLNLILSAPGRDLRTLHIWASVVQEERPQVRARTGGWAACPAAEPEPQHQVAQLPQGRVAARWPGLQGSSRGRGGRGRLCQQGSPTIPCPRAVLQNIQPSCGRHWASASLQ